VTEEVAAMTTQVRPRSDNGSVPAATLTRRAWWSLVGFVPSFFLAFLVGEGLVSALGYPVGGEEQAPWWVALVATVPALVVFAVPAVLAVWFGRRAVRLGDVRARVPMTVAVVVAGGFVLLNGFSALILVLS
jgi:Na+/melibiose symporter-like transporter